MMKSHEMSEWGYLLAKHGTVVFRTAYRILGRADEAEDCAQDVFVEAITRAEKIQADN